TDESPEQLEALIGAAIDLMAEVLAPLGRHLTTLPVGPEFPGRTAGPAFEMFYVMTNVAPWRQTAWALLAERAGTMADRVARVPGLGEVPAKAAAIVRTLETHR